MPVERWSPAQVVALAGDGGSLRAARGVGVPAAWPAHGRLDEVLWGLCRGSGQHPYQVCVDLSGPAYRCSCPSRKVPCKHALGLVLLWTAGGADGDPAGPDWVVEWRTSRTARAAKAAGVRQTAASQAGAGSAGDGATGDGGTVTGGPADAAAAARRARQRADRIAAGMAQLQRWLDDQIQQGLAGAERAGYQPYDAMAARLVDAQAATVAGTVRRLGTLAVMGGPASDRLLGELALLRLLVSAHQRIDRLPDGLAATVRSRIGFPITTEQVLAGPGIRDRWQVLGRVDTENDRLSTRSTWLRGADTGRFAQLLVFAAPGRTLPADPVPGTKLDAELHFYPAAWPLRAVLGTRYAAPAPMGAPTGGGSVLGALADWSAALAADPWRRTVPMLLADVLSDPAGCLVDAAGDALPLAPGHREPWWLLAASGGAPSTVAGEWSPDGLRPLAAWPPGRHVTAAAGLSVVADRAPELPGKLLAAALVGTARRPWAGSSVQVGDRRLTLGPADAPHGPAPGNAPDRGSPGNDGGPTGTSDAAELLAAAAVALGYRRAATTAITGHRPVPPAPAEQLGEVGPAAAARLRLLLGDGDTPGGARVVHRLLDQWLAAATECGVLVAPDTLPALLDVGRRRTDLRPAIAQVCGRRGRWLAAQRPEWAYLLAEAPGPGDEPGVADATPPSEPRGWQTGSTAERLDLLARLRRTDPTAGRDLLAGTFGAESADDRIRLLEVLEIGLSQADNAFLDRALDDRRREVREVAASLLRRLPGSAFSRRMAARASASVRYVGQGADAPRLAVDPPAEVDAGLRRDGVPTRPPANVGLGAWLLEEVIAATPLDTWTSATGRSPAGVVELAARHDWQAPLLHGWARAAGTQRDVAWAEALVATAERGTPGAGALPQQLAWDLHLVLPPARLARFAAEALRTDPARAHRLLAVSPEPWPDELSTAVVEQIARHARTDRQGWQLAELCRAAATALPSWYAVALADLSGQLQDEAVAVALRRPVAELAATLAFRHEMTLEFA